MALPKTYMAMNGSPVNIYESSEGVNMADNGGWIDGFYDSKEVALSAYNLVVSPRGGWTAISALWVKSWDYRGRNILARDLPKRPRGKAFKRMAKLHGF